MSKLQRLQEAKTKHDLAAILDVETSFLTYTLYKLRPEKQYEKFQIPKRSGGTRDIQAPTDRLKLLQSRLSHYLQDCLDEINKVESPISSPSVSHGFIRKKTIITNAVKHTHQRHVLNLDLADFFDSFNFGRVRGFFIANKNFRLDPSVATVIAQIACNKNVLPQGSPSSPVMTNFITHILDVHLAQLARKHSCLYTRYADDLTFSTRKSLFPKSIVSVQEGNIVIGKRLRQEIERANFKINPLKTRVQYKDSRQDVTGLIVNEKPNVKSEYRRAVRAQCHSLFKKGLFTERIYGETVEGNINVLEGRLNFIDQIDKFNRKRLKKKLRPEYVHRTGYATKELLSGREKLFSQFLYYRRFYAHESPIILCEGKTDNVYLKCAIRALAAHVPELIRYDNECDEYKLKVEFFKYSERTRFLLQLHGGTGHLGLFMDQFNQNYMLYNAPKPEQPVVIVLDNDEGADKFLNKLADIGAEYVHTTFKGSSKKSRQSRKQLNKHDLRQAEYVHVMHNLYVVLTPRADRDTQIEDLFNHNTRGYKLGDRSLSTENNYNHKTHYGKDQFANQVIRKYSQHIDFIGFIPLLGRIQLAIRHYHSHSKSSVTEAAAAQMTEVAEIA